MKWSDITHEHHGKRAEVWALSTPDKPHTRSSYTGTIACPENETVPFLVESATRMHYFAHWWNVTLLIPFDL